MHHHPCGAELQRTYPEKLCGRSKQDRECEMGRSDEEALDPHNPDNVAVPCQQLLKRRKGKAEKRDEEEEKTATEEMKK